MTKLLLLSCALALGACAMNEPVDDGPDAESRLAAELKGYRVDGPPQSCVTLSQLRGNRSVGEGAIVFDGAGRKWVNRPSGGCPTLNFGRSLQVKTSSSQLCRGDIATVIEPSWGGEFGSCALGDFEPYRRVRG
ncbi:MAG TPA: hypothetical protein VHM92_01495 [Allosphingosinicella sp.]|nr:hypothetical protein [Allosphingosinicella sp.]